MWFVESEDRMSKPQVYSLLQTGSSGLPQGNFALNIRMFGGLRVEHSGILNSCYRAWYKWAALFD
jgi:hypothetical protein